MVAGTPEFAAAAGPQGQLTSGVHTTLAPTWFDPAETPGIITRGWSCTRCTTRW
jgi:peptide/nickel transport system substrate-binding protein